jgi:hypothetical protein
MGIRAPAARWRVARGVGSMAKTRIQNRNGPGATMSIARPDVWRPPQPAVAREDAAGQGAPSAVAARGLPPWADQLACSVVGVSVRPGLRRSARGRTEDLRPEYLRAWGTIYIHRFNRLLRIDRTTARTRAELAQKEPEGPLKEGSGDPLENRAKARGRGVSQGWALARTALRNPSASRKPPD